MNKTMLAILSLTLIGTLQARPLDTPNAATTLKNALSKSVMVMDGVNGIGVTGCNPLSGEASLKGNFVHCVQIMTETEDAARALRILYPEGTKIKGVFVVILQIGRIGIQPRISVGN